MKTTKNITIGLLFAFALNSQAATVITYSESFNNSTGADAPLNTLSGWKANHGPTATAYDLSTANAGLAPVLSIAHYIFHNTTNSLGTSSFVFIDGLSAGAAASFDHVQTDIRNDDSSEDIKMVLKIDGSWYVTNTNYNATSTTTVSTTGSTWSVLNFTSGTEMSIGSAVTLPTTGTITGVGVYDESRISKIRLDNLQIHTVPEPTSALLLLTAGGLSLMRRRR